MHTEAEPPAPAPRRRELDVLRALIVLGLVFFHAALVFAPDDDFYVKNAETTDAVTVLAGLGVVWAMPMLFLVAGLGSRHSIRRRGPGGFARERLLRLGVPLLFASFALNPLPQWLRLRAADPGYHESYWRFWPRFLTVRPDPGDFPFVVDGRYFETGHLWFVVLLLAFCLLLVPVAGVVAAGGERAAAATARRPGLLLLPALPLALINALLGMEEDYAGWNRWAYLLFFLCGYALADAPGSAPPCAASPYRPACSGSPCSPRPHPGSWRGTTRSLRGVRSRWSPGRCSGRRDGAGWWRSWGCWTDPVNGAGPRAGAERCGDTSHSPRCRCTCCTSRSWSPSRTRWWDGPRRSRSSTPRSWPVHWR